MSDFLEKSALSRFKESVSVLIKESLKDVKNQCVSAEEVAFEVAFTCDCLKSWYDLKKKKENGNQLRRHSKRVFRRKIWFKRESMPF